MPPARRARGASWTTPHQTRRNHPWHSQAEDSPQCRPMGALALIRWRRWLGLLQASWVPAAHRLAAFLQVAPQGLAASCHLGPLLTSVRLRAYPLEADWGALRACRQAHPDSPLFRSNTPPRTTPFRSSPWDDPPWHAAWGEPRAASRYGPTPGTPWSATAAGRATNRRARTPHSGGGWWVSPRRSGADDAHLQQRGQRGPAGCADAGQSGRASLGWAGRGAAAARWARSDGRLAAVRADRAGRWRSQRPREHPIPGGAPSSPRAPPGARTDLGCARWATDGWRRHAPRPGTARPRAASRACRRGI